MAKIKVNSIVNKNDDGAPELTKGATVPSGQAFTAQGNVNVVGIVTASNFVGNGSQLTGLSLVTRAKVIALKVILDPLPFRS